MKKEPYDTGGRGVPPVSQMVEVLNAERAFPYFKCVEH